MHVMRKFVGKMAGSMAGVIVLTASSSKCDNRRQSVKDCEHPACVSKMDLFKRAQSAYSAPRDETTKGLTGSDGHSSVITSSSPPVNNCPLDRKELGRSTWNLLHTITAYYPDQPTAAEQESIRQLFLTLAQFYPCEVCAQDFRDSVAANPPRVESREALVLWCCHLHNEVNAKLGLPVWPCVLADLDERWLKGKPRCWENQEE